VTHGISQNNWVPSDTWYIPEEQNWIPSDTWYIPEEQNWVPSDTWYIPGEQNWVPSDSCGIFQKNRTGYPVTHVVYPRRTELVIHTFVVYPRRIKNPERQHSVIINYFDIPLLKLD